MKKMKKSMFFSSILMIVVLVVALSTSTFAWFTSSSDVSTAETALYSATSADANISIGWAPGQRLTSVSFNPSREGGISPMIPTTDFSAKATTAQAAAFIKGNATLDGNGDFLFGTDDEPATPWTQSQLGGETTTLFIMNWNTLAGATVTITPSVSAVLTEAEGEAIDGAVDITDAFRLACWAGTEYLGTFGGTSHWAEGWTAGTPTSELTQTFGGVGTFSFDIDAATSSSATSKQIFLIAWFDGTVLWDDWADQAVTFSLAVEAVSLADEGEGD